MPYQGYAISDGTAGLPSLPQLGDVAGLLNGATQLRIWYAGRDRWRVDQIDTGTEHDLYQTPEAQELWDFASNQLSLIVGEPPVRLPRGADLAPPDLARRLLSTGSPLVVQPSNGTDTGTSVSRLPARRVAGIAAAGVRLTPTTADTTIAHVDIWADPISGLPLEVQLTSRGATGPVLQSRFLSVRLSAPAISVVTPPVRGGSTGFTVTSGTDALSAFNSLRFGPLPDSIAGQPRNPGGSELAGIGVYGTGFAQFVVVPVPRRTGFQAFDSATKAGGTQVRLPGGDGVMVATASLTVFVMDSDRVRRNYLLAGMVSPALLTAAAAQLSTYEGVP